ncbi:unnamed protein product, partial [Prorocentrum cordatum]
RALGRRAGRRAPHRAPGARRARAARARRAAARAPGRPEGRRGGDAATGRAPGGGECEAAPEDTAGRGRLSLGLPRLPDQGGPQREDAEARPADAGAAESDAGGRQAVSGGRRGRGAGSPRVPGRHAHGPVPGPARRVAQGAAASGGGPPIPWEAVRRGLARSHDSCAPKTDEEVWAILRAKAPAWARRCTLGARLGTGSIGQVHALLPREGAAGTTGGGEAVAKISFHEEHWKMREDFAAMAALGINTGPDEVSTLLRSIWLFVQDSIRQIEGEFDMRREANFTRLGKQMVEEAKANLNAVMTEGKPKSFMKQLLSASEQEAHKSRVIDLEAEYKLQGDEDEELKTQVLAAKRAAIKDLKVGAQAYGGQINARIDQAKAKAAAQGGRALQDGYLLLETYLKFHESQPVEPAFAGMGINACFTSVRQQAASERGSHGGVTAMVRNHYHAKLFREMATRGSVSYWAADTTSVASAELLNFTDWVPMLWHMKGYSILVVSVYLECHKPLRTGPNANRLKKLGWPEALGTGHILALGENAATCFEKDATPSPIDYFVVSLAARQHIRSLAPVSDIPWRPHIGQVLALKGELQMNVQRQLQMPQPVQHPRLPQKAPDLTGVADKAPREALDSMRHDQRSSGRDYTHWLTNICDNGAMHRMTKPSNCREDEMTDGRVHLRETRPQGSDLRLDGGSRSTESCHASDYKHDDATPKHADELGQDGSIGDIIFLLWELGWDPQRADYWVDPLGDAWQRSGDDANGDPTDVLGASRNKWSYANEKKKQPASTTTATASSTELIEAQDLASHLDHLQKRGKKERIIYQRADHLKERAKEGADGDGYACKGQEYEQQHGGHYLGRGRPTERTQDNLKYLNWHGSGAEKQTYELIEPLASTHYQQRGGTAMAYRREAFFAELPADEFTPWEAAIREALLGVFRHRSGPDPGAEPAPTATVAHPPERRAPSYYRSLRRLPEVGPMVLFYGCRHEREEFFYKEEWELYKKSGVLTEIVCAFSHDKPHYPPKMVFVNQKMEENLGMIGKYMGQLGGYFYMCGLAVAAPGIETALKKAMIGAGVVKEAQADTWIEDLKKSGRYSMESY